MYGVLSPIHSKAERHMSAHAKNGRARFVVYVLLLAGIGWQAFRIAGHLSEPAAMSHSGYHIVYVDGNVDRPGKYRVPDGTSRFELLRVAGVRPTSDISALNLAGQLQESENLSVGTLSSPATVSSRNNAVRLEFFLGDITIESKAGNVRPREPGLVLLEGDRIFADSASQAEVSMGPFTRIDMDAGAELVLDKLPREAGERSYEVYQHKGTCWYRVVYATKGERMKVVTPAATAMPGGTGADYMVELGARTTRIHVLEGQVTVQRPGGEEVINLVSNQTLTVFPNRPFQVTRTASDVSAQRIFAELQKERTDLVVKNAPVNFVFCTLPDNYYFISVRYDESRAVVVSIPGETSVENFARGFNTLGQAFLLGGGPFVQSMVEQLLSTRVERYCALDKQGLLQIVTTLGSITVEVDDRAARFMSLRPGRQPLNAEQVFTFLKPRISGSEDTRMREERVLRSLFDAVRGGSIVVTSALAQRALTVMESNFTAPEVVGAYAKFRAKQGWSMSMDHLPGARRRVGNATVFTPDPSAARRLLFGEG
ncbi:MAG: hypothetical protein GF331_01990 [Chitinivibrionales bacterium]|nr:hypothetical protein [Chitinivibrionales bacterium]